MFGCHIGHSFPGFICDILSLARMQADSPQLQRPDFTVVRRRPTEAASKPVKWVVRRGLEAAAGSAPEKKPDFEQAIGT